MISPQLHPDSPTSCPSVSLDGGFHGDMDLAPPTPEEPQLVAVTAADDGTRRTTDAVVDGLWYCLMRSILAGLGVSAVLCVVVLALSHIG